MMKKNRILLIGNSNIANKRYINTFNKNKVQFSVASKSSKKKLKMHTNNILIMKKQFPPLMLI